MRPIYWSGAGRSERPIRYSSTPRAHAPAFGNRPHDERLAALHVAGGEHAGHARHPVLVAPDVAAVGHLDAELRRACRCAPGRGIPSPAARGRPSARSRCPATGSNVEAAVLVRHFHLMRVQRRDTAGRVAGELLRRDGIDAFAAFFVRGRHAEDVRPERPRIARRRARRAAAAAARAGARSPRPDDARCRGSRRRCRRRR